MSETSFITIREIAKFDGQSVRMRGWLHNKRSSGPIQFLQLRDGYGVIQCVAVKSELGEEEFTKAEKLTQESSFAVTGVVRADKRSPIGYEISVRSIEIYSLSHEYPISPKDHGVAFLMEHRHLWLRSKRQHAILRIRSEIVKAIRDYFDANQFTLLDAPIFTPAACEGTSTLFETDYFGDKAYLTQSGQLYMEAGAMAFGKVYCFGPTFRAEKSKTRRHLTEFWMVEPEMAFFDLEADMNLAEDFVVSIVSRVLADRAEELKILERDTQLLEAVRKPFPRVPYGDAVKVLKKAGAQVEWGDDFGGDEETLLTKQFDRPIVVHRFPLANKAFYMKEDPADPRLSLSMDVLAPEGYGEIIGGGQREESLEKLEKRIKEHGLPRSAFEWYLDLRRYGSVPHAGFGLGLERTVAWICGLHHVRETIPFPRMMERITP
ncbi:MAG TPA: asparagine--tRNA ligase [Bdellovibrionota bacterium]|nr:asparagine--tRNA ligase [Bdellovibrionota bacterium]